MCFQTKNSILQASNQPIDLTNKQANDNQIKDQINYLFKLLNYLKHFNHSTDLVANQNGLIENKLIKSDNLVLSNNQVNSFNSELFQLYANNANRNFTNVNN